MFIKLSFSSTGADQQTKLCVEGTVLRDFFKINICLASNSPSPIVPSQLFFAHGLRFSFSKLLEKVNSAQGIF